MEPARDPHTLNSRQPTRSDVKRACAIAGTFAAVDPGVLFGGSLVWSTEPPKPTSWIRTTLIGQETGTSYARGVPATNNTTKWGGPGRDMGCPVEFNGKLYLLFGDVPSFPGVTNIPDADPLLPCCCAACYRGVAYGQVARSA